MFKSYSLGKVAGIELKMHGTFFLLIAFLALSGLISGGTTTMVVEVLFVLTLFGVVVLHELGHALMARRLGIPTRDIVLTPIGGIASLARIPTRPVHELLITAAGPAVNVVLASLAYPAALLIAPASPVAGWALNQFFWMNVILAGFNLLPAFPMDGGRLLRAYLAMKGDYLQATRTAARIGRMMAWVFGLAGLFVTPMLILIGVFVWFGATAEEAAVAVRYRAANHPLQFVVGSMFGRPTVDADGPDILFSRPSAGPRRPNVVVDADYTVRR